MRLMMPKKGRGATDNPAGRFEERSFEAVDDGWGSLDELMGAPAPATELFADTSRTVIARNDSPDIPFEQSINPYRGCEHGCVYCYARPSHNFLGLSSGLDFETRIAVKHDAAELLRRELQKPGYQPRPIALGSNTDPYQPAERRLEITRSILEVLNETRHPLSVVTKSTLVLRDLDLLRSLAGHDLVRVFVSITTLDRTLARKLEPRAAAPHRRLETVAMLKEAGVPVGVMTAPVIPGLTDHEIEALLEKAAEAGAESAGWVLLRLPHDVKDLFEAWLKEHYPLKRERILSLIRQSREGRLNDPEFGSRMKGSGAYAELIGRRFKRAAQRLGLNQKRTALRSDLFRPPGERNQLDLFAGG